MELEPGAGVVVFPPGLLFEALVASGRMPAGPVEAMRSQHRAIESPLGQILAPAGAAGRPDPQRTVLRLVETVRHHEYFGELANI